jgi:hypothetical protein
MVLMDFDVPTVKAHADLLGFDAISMYALPGGSVEVDIIIGLYEDRLMHLIDFRARHSSI